MRAGVVVGQGFAAVVLAGGAGRRVGGADKPVLTVGGRPMLERVLAAVGDAAPRIVVGPPGLAVPSGVLTTLEAPAGGGPVAAAAAGLALVPPGVAEVALLAADLPLLTAEAVAVLRSALHAGPGGALGMAGEDASDGEPGSVLSGPGGGGFGGSGGGAVGGLGDASGGLGGGAPGGHGGALGGQSGALGRSGSTLDSPLDSAGRDGAVFVDAGGRRQTLCGVWWAASLRAALGRLAARRGGLSGAAMRELSNEAAVVDVSWVGSGPPPWFDCDTDADLRRAEEWAR